MPIFECWEKFKGKDLHKLIAKRTGIEHPLTVQDKEAYRKAAEDFQKENINNLNNIYSDLGLKDYKKTEPPKESIPSVSGENKLVITNEKVDIKDEVTDEKIGEREIKNFNINFPDGAKAMGYIENETAHITGINSAKDGITPKRGTKTFERVISQLRENGIKTIKIGNQSQDSRVALQKLVEQGVLENPRENIGISVDEHPSKFDISEQSLPKEQKAPSVSGVEGNKVYVSKFPKAEVPISEMNSEQLVEHSKKVKDYLKNQEVEFFGEEGAKKYREARSISYSGSASDPRVKEADKVMKEMEDSLTEEQRNDFFGTNQPEGIYDPAEIRDIATRVRLVEESENVTELGGALKLPLLEFNRNPNNEGTLAVLNAAKKKAEELKLDPTEVFVAGIKRIAKDLPDKSDAEFLAQSILEKISKPPEKISLPDEKINQQGNETPKEETNPADQAKSPLDETMSKYGWTTETKGDDIVLINRNGKAVATIKQKGNKYTIEDNAGNKILSGSGQLEKSAEKVATEYFYAKETPKPPTNETTIQKTNPADQQSQQQTTEGIEQPPKPPEETKGAAEGQENKVGIHVEYPPTSVNYMGTGKLETEFGIEEREPTQRKRDIYTIKEADELLDKGWNIQKELNKVDSGEKTFISDAEYINFTRYAAELSDRLRGIKDVKSPEYDRTLRELNRVANAANTAGKDTARALGIRGRFSTVAEGSYGEFMLNEMAANNDAPLTEKQKETAHAEFEKLDATRKKLDEDTKAFEEKVSAFRAEQELGKTKKSASSGKKRTHEDLVKEREDILKNIGNKWKDAGKDVLSSDIPFRKQIAAIAPDVLKLAKNLVEDGIIKLEDVVKNIHEKIKPNAPEVEEKDIHDIIAGEYNKKKITKKDAAIAMENLRIEAQLLNKYERLLKGEEPKNEKAKRKRNQEIEDLRKKIKDLRKEESESNKFYGESDAAERKEFDNEKREANKFYGEEKDAELKKLESLQKRNESETKKIKEKIAEGDFELPVKKTPLMEDKELQKKFPEQFKATQKAVDDYIKVKREIALRRLKQMYENKTPEEKTIEIFSKALNVPRTLMASFDFSAPLRQAIVATTAHPQIASKALKFMFEAAKDEKVYNRWIDNVHSDPRWSVAEKTKLGITDPESLHVKKAEEAFQGAPYAEKIPIVGVGVKASERAYIGFLNKLRWDLFNMYADRFEEQGKTYENNQKLYEGISSFINSETGRGGMKGLENAAPVLNWFLFASKLIASRLNMLGLSDIPNLTVRGATLGKYGLDYGFYTRLPKEIRIEAAKDMAKFLAVGIATLVLANQLGASVELDPRSSDFGKIKIGNTRWDIWGGFQPYARVLTQSLTGERKTTTTGNIQQLDGKGFMGQTRFTPIINFARGKLAPVPASVIDLAIKKDAAGQPVTIQGELIGDVVPLVIQDTYAAMKDQGVKALFTVGIPSAFGVGVQTYKPREIKSTQQKIKSMNKSSSKKTANKTMNK